MQGRSSCLLARRSSLVVCSVQIEYSTAPEVDRDLGSDDDVSRRRNQPVTVARNPDVKISWRTRAGSVWGGAGRSGKVKSLIDGQDENRKGFR